MQFLISTLSPYRGFLLAGQQKGKRDTPAVMTDGPWHDSRMTGQRGGRPGGYGQHGQRREAGRLPTQKVLTCDRQALC